MKSIFQPFFLISFILLTLTSCDTQTQTKPYPFDYSDATMGTTFNVKVSQLPESIAIEDLKHKIKTLLDSLNKRLSTYDKQSELSLFNQNNSTDWQIVSSDLFTVLQEAQNISAISNGAFDITVGPLVNLWGFGTTPMSFQAPEPEKIQQLKSIIGYQKLDIQAENLKIKKTIPELYLDLSAIAKGYAVDRVALLLESLKIDNYLVEIGGELRLKGLNNHDKPWSIAIEKPTPEKRMLQKVLPITNTAIATSGDYRNFFESNGIRYSHTIDPRTGETIKHNLASVTVLSDMSMRADALATAFMVLGTEKALEVAQKYQIAAFFIVKTEEGFEEKSSSAWLKRIEEKQ